MSWRETLQSIRAGLSDKSGKGALDAIIGLIIIIVGIYLAVFVLGLVLRIAVLVIVVAVAIWLFSKLISGAKKIGGG
jgi:hypothetical protein